MDRAAASGAACGGSIPLRRAIFMDYRGTYSLFLNWEILLWLCFEIHIFIGLKRAK